MMNDKTMNDTKNTEWRDLLPGDRIEEGDEFFSGLSDDWHQVKISVGNLVLPEETNLYRTRRPSPNPPPNQQNTVEKRIEELKLTCPVWETHVEELERLAKEAYEAHKLTCENSQREIEKLLAENAELKTENVCLQELIQEFYEWSRRDFRTEQEVREIMNRYYNLLNK